MSSENDRQYEQATSNPELQKLIDGVVEQVIKRIGGVALKPYLPSKQCAQLIDVTPEHLCAMRARGEGPPWSGYGKWTRYERRAVLTWIAALPKEKETVTDACAAVPVQGGCSQSDELSGDANSTPSAEKDAAS